MAGDDASQALGRMAAYVVIILILGALAIIVGKRYLPRLSPGGGRGIRVVDSAYLGPRKQLHVVQVGQRRFLLASCRDSVGMLSELTGSFPEVYERKVASAEGRADQTETPDAEAL